MSLRNFGWTTMNRLEQLWRLVGFPKQALGDIETHQNFEKKLINFFTSLPSLPSVQKSSLPFRGIHGS